jgi:steroid delta-isomerase-like uncharacterized protein
MTEVQTRTPEQTARAVIERFGARDVAGMVALYAPDVRDDIVAEERVAAGREEVAAYVGAFVDALPDLRIEVHRTVAQGSSAAIEWTATGTFTGAPMTGLAPTGARVTLRGLDVMEVERGLVVRNAAYFDTGGVARDLGLQPPAGSRGEKAALALANSVIRLKDFFLTPAPIPPQRRTVALPDGATASPEALARRVFALLNVQDLDTVERTLWSERLVVDDVTAPAPLIGARAVRAYFAELLAGVPDFVNEPQQVFGDDRTAVVLWEATGTNVGEPMRGLRATGRRLRLRGVDLMEFEDGRLVRNTIYYDSQTMARQLGVAPRAGGRAERAMIGAANLATRARRRRGKHAPA